jgi:peptidoglycan/LPS O-acetylase OafA/YrhL
VQNAEADAVKASSAPPRGPETFPWLDGLRGGAAMWVLLSHVQILSGTPGIPVLSWGGLAVDLFMMLSGFLMAHHYQHRQAREPWTEPRTWAIFWTRRFFRIAPLYYVLLAVAVVLAPYIGNARDSVAAIWPGTGTDSSRYAGFDLANVVAHMTFVFGAWPHYAFRTVLPDWSIGLEMQFYLAFPFLMLLVRRAGPLLAGVALIIACLTLQWQFRRFFDAFAMPSFLPIKLYVFFIGIWIASSRAGRSMRAALIVSVLLTSAAAVHARSPEAGGRVALVAALFYLMSNGTLPALGVVSRGVDRVRAALSGRLARFLGDTSYGLYLVHLLVLVPVAGALAQLPIYVAAPSALRFTTCVVLVVPTSLALAWLVHRAVERPGMRLGKYVINWFVSERVKVARSGSAAR